MTTKDDRSVTNRQTKCELYNDHFQNFKVYGIPHAQLIIADPPYNLGVNAYASNLYQSEMQENGVLYVALFNRAQDVNK